MGGTYRWPGGVLWIADCIACHSQCASHTKPHQTWYSGSGARAAEFSKAECKAECKVRCAVQGSYSLRVSKLPLKKNRPPPAPAGAAKRAHHAMHAPVCHTPVVWFD